MNGFFTKGLSMLMLLFIFNFVVSCVYDDECPPPILYYLTDVHVKAIQKVDDGNSGYTVEYTDTLFGEIAFEVRPEVEFAALERKMNFGLMNVAYGDCIGNYPLNPAIDELSVFSCDKAIYWNGTTIPANSNLLEHPEFKSVIQFPSFFDYEGYSIVEIQDLHIKYPNGMYGFYFEWETDNGTILSDNVEVYIQR